MGGPHPGFSDDEDEEEDEGGARAAGARALAPAGPAESESAAALQEATEAAWETVWGAVQQLADRLQVAGSACAWAA